MFRNQKEDPADSDVMKKAKMCHEVDYLKEL